MRQRAEAPRDQGESAFTPLLRSAFRSDRRILAVAFVDCEGECVDYCAELEPFDTKIAAAQLLVVMADLTRRVSRCGFGLAYDLAIEGQDRSFLIRRIDEDYLLVAVVTPDAISDPIRHIVARTVTGFRREAGLRRPRFEAHLPQLQVEVRPAVGWPYAPKAFRRSTEAPWETVAVVLGRWLDRHAGLICFRLRSQTGAELTVAYDDDIDRWTAVDDGVYDEGGGGLDVRLSSEVGEK